MSEKEGSEKDDRAQDEAAGSSTDTSNKDKTAETGWISDLLSKLKISKGPQEKILPEATLECVAEYMKSGKCRNVIVMAGAGISTSAGIPDFRSPNSGLYAKIKEQYKLADPQIMFEINFFKQNPKPFFTLAKELLPETFEPTISHYFCRLLHEKGLLLRHFTQNIDGLERKAGLPEEKIVEAHGTFYTSHCMKCNKEYPFEWMREKIAKDEVPKCTKCSNLVKPDVVFFGENLPQRFYLCLKDLLDCDLLIIMGTSLQVQPFASLINKVPKSCPRVLINREVVGSRSNSMIEQLLNSGLGEVDSDILDDLLGQGFDFKGKRNKDVAILGDCDDGAMRLAKALDWDADLLHLTTHHDIPE